MSPGPKNIWGGPEPSSVPKPPTPLPIRRATTGSAGLDLNATSGVVLTPNMGVQIIDTDMKGPLPKGTVGILLGRSSSTMRGLVIFPGVIDSDYMGTFKVLCHSPYGVVSIAPGDRIAQLLILPSQHDQFPACSTARGKAALGSSGIDLTCLSMELDQRPILNLEIEGRIFPGLLDTGADRSIIRAQAWPKAWPLQQSSQSLQGLGYAHTPHVSAKELTWRSDGKKGKVQPFVVDVPINLWGRDIQQQLGFRLTNDYSPVSKNIMKHQGYVPGMGLGKRLQGIQSPIEPTQKMDRKGLGFS